MNDTPLYDVNTTITQASIKVSVNNLIETFFSNNIARSKVLDERYGELWRAMREQAVSGGKRLRPYFVMAAYEAYGGKEYDRIMPVAAAHELLHISLLIHDDIIDKDYMRHGYNNVAGTMLKFYEAFGAGVNTEHFANSAALLAGDLLISGAYSMVLQSTLSDQQKSLAMALLGESIFYVGGGEFLDTESSFLPEVIDPLKIADLKTARYSFVLPLVTGATLAEAPQNELKLLEKFGIALGIAFQLVDDLLGIYGDPLITGKSVLSDIREGKKTFIMLLAKSSASAEDKEILERLVGNPLVTENDALKVREVLERCGAKALCEAKINNYCQEAITVLDKLSISGMSRQNLRAIVERATVRLS